MSSLLQILENAQHATFDEWGSIRSNKDLIIKSVCENLYWTRAWITQEILSVRYVTVWLNIDSISLAELIKGTQYFCLINETTQDNTPFSQFATGGAWNP
jgi:hypothetical protein